MTAGFDYPNSLKADLVCNFLLDAWLSAAQKKYSEINQPTLNALDNHLRLIAAIDDALDLRRKKITRSTFKEERIDKIRKNYFDGLELMGEAGKRRIKTCFSKSTKRMVAAVKSHTKLKSLDDVIELRKGTSGEMFASSVAVFNAGHGIPPADAKKIEDAFANCGMLAQIGDDVHDLGKDRQTRTEENIVYWLLKRHPDELRRVGAALSPNARCGFGWLKKIAPKTASEALALQESYIKAIPDEPRFARLRSLCTVFKGR